MKVQLAVDMFLFISNHKCLLIDVYWLLISDTFQTRTQMIEVSYIYKHVKAQTSIQQINNLKHG